MRHLMPPRRPLLAAALLASCLAAAACSDPGAPRTGGLVDDSATPLVAGSAAELAAARQRWEAAGITRYRFTEGRGCFCADSRSVRLDVARAAEPPHHEAVQSVAYDDEGPEGPVRYPEFFLTVGGLFATIQHAIDNHVEILVRYHPVYGYPTTVDVEPSQHPMDGGVLYQVRRFEILERQ